MDKKILMLDPSMMPIEADISRQQVQNAAILELVEVERDFLGNVYRMLEMKQYDEAKKWLGLHLDILGNWALDLQG
jgi:hypothetical protein